MPEYRLCPVCHRTNEGPVYRCAAGHIFCIFCSSHKGIIRTYCRCDQRAVRIGRFRVPGSLCWYCGYFNQESAEFCNCGSSLRAPQTPTVRVCWRLGRILDGVCGAALICGVIWFLVASPRGPVAPVPFRLRHPFTTGPLSSNEAVDWSQMPQWAIAQLVWLLPLLGAWALKSWCEHVGAEGVRRSLAGFPLISNKSGCDTFLAFEKEDAVAFGEVARASATATGSVHTYVCRQVDEGRGRLIVGSPRASVIREEGEYALVKVVGGHQTNTEGWIPRSWIS